MQRRTARAICHKIQSCGPSRPIEDPLYHCAPRRSLRRRSLEMPQSAPTRSIPAFSHPQENRDCFLGSSENETRLLDNRPLHQGSHHLDSLRNRGRDGARSRRRKTDTALACLTFSLSDQSHQLIGKSLIGVGKSDSFRIFAFPEDQNVIAGARDADVGVASLSWTIDHTTHYGDLER